VTASGVPLLELANAAAAGLQAMGLEIKACAAGGPLDHPGQSQLS
jgi:hypothetical protein